MLHKSNSEILCNTFKKSERMVFSIDFWRGSLYIYVSEGEQSAGNAAKRRLTKISTCDLSTTDGR